MSAPSFTARLDLDGAIQQVHRDLDQVRQVKKCTSCECLLDVLAGVRSDLADVATPTAESARADFQRWWADGDKKRHRCPGCEVCLPIAPYNQFSATLGGTESTSPEATTTRACGPTCASCHTQAPEPAPEPATAWPPVPGDYVVGDPSASVAVCTLADTDLPGELRAAGLLERVAILGTLTTENLGIEHLIRNVAANPSIRSLVLCGRDSRGHRAGQSLLALKANGTDEQRRILGAPGPRPVLKNVGDDELVAFRARVSLLDEIGTTDPGRVIEVVRACAAQDGAAPVELAPRALLPKLIEAQPPAKSEWVHDPEGFFLVLLDRDRGAIVCEHYTKDGTLNEIIRGTHAGDIAGTAIKRGLLSRLDHAAYLGRELARAEDALTFAVPYTQDTVLQRDAADRATRQ